MRGRSAKRTERKSIGGIHVRYFAELSGLGNLSCVIWSRTLRVKHHIWQERVQRIQPYKEYSSRQFAASIWNITDLIPHLSNTIYPRKRLGKRSWVDLIKFQYTRARFRGPFALHAAPSSTWKGHTLLKRLIIYSDVEVIDEKEAVEKYRMKKGVGISEA